MKILRKLKRSRLGRFVRRALSRIGSSHVARIAQAHKLDRTGLQLEIAAGALTAADIGARASTVELAAAALSEGRFKHPKFSTHVDYQPPAPDVVFVSVVNDKYAPGLEALVLSLLRLYPGMRNRYVIYHDGNLSDFNQKRLLGLYPHFEFHFGDTARYSIALSSYPNHKRVGLLGYLSLEALGIEASHVVIFDSDLVFLADISPLWTSTRICAVPDIGAKPFCIVSGVSHRQTINSGVLSFPRSHLGARATAKRDRVLAQLDHLRDEDIARFADQRFWNFYLADEDVELLPQNFNCVKTLLTRFFPDELNSVSVLHMTGPKPWYSFIHSDLLTDTEREHHPSAAKHLASVFILWNQIYQRELLRVRLTNFREDVAGEYRAIANSLAERPVAFIGNGPSLKHTDLTAFARYEKFVFNWFVNHPDWDALRPDHLIIPSHMLFGGWHTPRPELPAKYLEALRSHSHRPRIWFSYYFKDYVEDLPELEGYQKSYFFFEKPFKRRMARHGQLGLDLNQPLVDANTGVLTAALPIALHMGARRIVLVGCDSNYSSAQGSYFYDASSHASKTTRESSLLKTWEEGGEGHYGYELARRELDARGVQFWDATVGGSLRMLPRLTIEEARKLA